MTLLFHIKDFGHARSMQTWMSAWELYDSGKFLRVLFLRIRVNREIYH